MISCMVSLKSSVSPISKPKCRDVLLIDLKVFSAESFYGNHFELKLFAVDAGQTMFLAIDLLKIAYTPDNRIAPFRVSTHFCFDPSVVQSIAKGFKRQFRSD